MWWWKNMKNRNYILTFLFWILSCSGGILFISFFYELPILNFHLIENKEHVFLLLLLGTIFNLFAFHLIVLLAPYKKNKELLKYKFINNSILLTMETIEKNGCKIIWTQNNGDTHQILCFNEKENDFKAFDKYLWSNQNNSLKKDFSEIDCEFKAVELWTPIELQYTNNWINNIFNH